MGPCLTKFYRTQLFELPGATDSLLELPGITDSGQLTQTCGTKAPGELADFVASRTCRDGGCGGKYRDVFMTQNLGNFRWILFYGARLACGKKFFPRTLLCEPTVNAMLPHPPVQCSFGWGKKDAHRPESVSVQIIYHSEGCGRTLCLHRFRAPISCGDADDVSL